MTPAAWAIPITIPFIILIVSIARAQPEPLVPRIDPEKEIKALMEIENWDGKSVGAAGEIGPWQLAPAVWMQHSKFPHQWATCRTPAQAAETDRVVRAHLEWVRKQIWRQGYEESPYIVALFWTCGIGTFRSGLVPAAKIDYATRANNLYSTLK